jgi:cell division transport system permease protein
MNHIYVLIKRIFRFGWQSLARDGGMISANVFIMTMAVFMITSIFFLKDISQFLVNSIEDKVDVSVYFKENVLEEDILKVKQEIVLVPEVKEVNYVSKEQALENFVNRHGNNPVLMEALVEVGANPFLASLGVKAFEAEQYTSVVSFLEGFQSSYLIEKIDYYERKPVIERIYNLTSSFNKAGIVFSLILIIVAFLVTFNAVRLSIYNSREEIKVQRLVGASNWFIRGPFLVQGVICGFFAAIICLITFGLLSWGFNSKAEFLFPGINLFNFFLSNFWLILLIQLFSGISLGTLSSLIAVKKYLKV